MKQGLGLFLFSIFLTSTALGGNSTLYLRATIPKTFKVTLTDGEPKLLTNTDSTLIKPIMKVEKNGDLYRVTVIHP